MAQTEAGQNAARRKMATSEMGSYNKNAQAKGVAGFNQPKPPAGASDKKAALRKKQIKTNIGV